MYCDSKWDVIPKQVLSMVMIRFHSYVRNTFRRVPCSNNPAKRWQPLGHNGWDRREWQRKQPLEKQGNTRPLLIYRHRVNVSGPTCAYSNDICRPSCFTTRTQYRPTLFAASANGSCWPGTYLRGGRYIYVKRINNQQHSPAFDELHNCLRICPLISSHFDVTLQTSLKLYRFCAGKWESPETRQWSTDCSTIAPTMEKQ